MTKLTTTLFNFPFVRGIMVGVMIVLFLISQQLDN